MRIFNEDKTQELKDVDLTKGRLVNDVLVKHFDYVEEVSHYEVVKEYDNGGKDIRQIIDVEGVEEHDETEHIRVYIPYTEKELREIQLNNELRDLEDWFLEVYDNQVKQYERCQRLGLDFDKDMVALDNEATQKQLRIREIRRELNGK